MAFVRLRASRAADTSSTEATAIWRTTSTFRRRDARRASPAAAGVAAQCARGGRPEAVERRRETEHQSAEAARRDVNMMTGASTPASSNARLLRREDTTAARRRSTARTIRPSAPPAPPSTRLSVSICRTMRAAARAERQTHRDLPAPRRGARQQQPGDVRAGDQQHERHRRHQDRANHRDLRRGTADACACAAGPPSAGGRSAAASVPRLLSGNSAASRAAMASSCVCACRALDAFRAAVRRSTRPRLPRLDALCAASGVQMSMASPRFSPVKRGGATPTMVRRSAVEHDLRPIADGEPPNARCHSPSAMTADRSRASGVESARSKRPAQRGRTPEHVEELAATRRMVRTRSGCSPTRTCRPLPR